MSFRKPNRRKNKRKKRCWLTKHHDHAKSLGGTLDFFNIFMLSEKHHQAYHSLFGLRTFAEAAEVLNRMEKMHKETVMNRDSVKCKGCDAVVAPFAPDRIQVGLEVWHKNCYLKARNEYEDKQKQILKRTARYGE